MEDDSDQYQQNAELIPPFLPEQRVFCFDLTKKTGQVSPKTASGSRRYYEAVVRQVRHHPNVDDPSKRWSCLVHYQGWNSRWDHWVYPGDLVHDTPEHRQRFETQQKKEEAKRQTESEAQKQKQNRKQQKKKEQLQSTTKSASPGGPSCDLPFTLKTILVDEWEKITRRGYDAPHGFDNDLKPKSENSKSSSPNQTTTAKSDEIKTTRPARSVYSLPSPVSVRQLLKHFEKKERKKWQQKLEEKEEQQKVSVEGGNEGKELPKEMSAKESIPTDPKQEVRQFCRGLGRLFEEALPVCLLYPEERPQYQHYVKEAKAFAIDVYGCEFFLRLLIRLPLLLKRPLEFPAFLTDLIILLQQNRPACFKGKFRPPEYPHEWLDWEQKHYGDPRLHEQADVAPGVKDDDGGDSSGSEDLFS